MLQEEIIQKIKALLGEEIEIDQIKLVRPTDSLHGDFTTSIALIASKKLGKKPLEIAYELKEKLGSVDGIEKIEVAGPGFINFFIKKDNLLDNLSEILEKGDNYGKSEKNKGKRVIVEYSSPNIAKPFTVGHLRSTIIGDAIANLLAATGWEVIRDNHLGDWGTQFGKQIYAIKEWGDEKKIEQSENPVKELVALYVKFHEEAQGDESLEEKAREWFKKLEDGDIEAKRIWQFCIEISKKEFEKIYSELGINFDTQYGESFFEDKMGSVIEELRKKNLLKKDEGAELVYFEKDKFPPLMVIKSDGTTLYATRDLATDKFRLDEYGKDTVIINEVGIEQSLYFRQLFELEKMLGWVKDGQRIHIRHGHYRFEEGKMSTRKGNAIWLEDVLEEAKKRALAFSKVDMKIEDSFATSKSLKHSESARKNLPKGGATITNMQVVGIGALKWNDLKRNSQQDIVFNWDDILNMQGDSGPYIQYTYARICSILQRAGVSNFQFPISNLNLESEELELVRMLTKFSEVIQQAGDTFSPNILCNYLFELCQKFNLFYQKHKIIGGEKEEFKLVLTAAVGQVIKNGLYLLGISAPERM